MSLVKPIYKTFLIPMAVSIIVIFSFFTIYFFTRGSFFDGVLLTIVGIASMFFTLVLSVLVFKALSDLLVRDSYRVISACLSFGLTIVFTLFIIIGVFRLIAGKIQL